jgi:hypothetical protein
MACAGPTRLYPQTPDRFGKRGVMGRIAVNGI